MPGGEIEMFMEVLLFTSMAIGWRIASCPTLRATFGAGRGLTASSQAERGNMTTEEQIDAWRKQAQDDQQQAAELDAMEIVSALFHWIVQDVLHLEIGE